MKKSLSLLSLLSIFSLSFLALACADQTNRDAYDSASETEEHNSDSDQGHDEEGVGQDGDSDKQVLAPSNQFNLNTASDEDFDQIPGITDHMKYEFDEYRPYASISEFRKEMSKYIDAEQIAAYEKYLYVPVDFNASDALSLQQIPGINETIAEAIIADRPYNSDEAFISKAKSLMPTFDAEAAAKFLSK